MTALVDGELRAAAHDALIDIARALPAPGASASDATLGNGEAGFALFHGHLALSGLLTEKGAVRELEIMFEHVQAAADKLAPLAERVDLFSGFIGVAWTVAHLRHAGVLDDGEELCEATDAAVLDSLRNRSCPMLCELVAGLSGIGVYGLARRDTAAGLEIVAEVVAALAETAIRVDGWRTWFHSPDRLYSAALRTHPSGCFNLGLAHGVPGAIAFLGRAAALGNTTARDLTHEASTWLLRQQREYHNGSRFGYSFVTDPFEEPEGSRIAWCYGDLGVSAALLLAARRTADAELESSAVDLALRAAARTDERSGVVDAGLCHGAFGNAHLFARLYAAKREPAFGTAAIEWLRAGLSMRGPQGPAGFSAYRPLIDGEPSRDLWLPSAALIDGIAGIGLVLIDLLAPGASSWDEVLLVDIPPAKG